MHSPGIISLLLKIIFAYPLFRSFSNTHSEEDDILTLKTFKSIEESEEVGGKEAKPARAPRRTNVTTSTTLPWLLGQPVEFALTLPDWSPRQLERYDLGLKVVAPSRRKRDGGDAVNGGQEEEVPEVRLRSHPDGTIRGRFVPLAVGKFCFPKS